MKKQEYLRQISQENGYCSCPELRGLYEERKMADSLVAKCDFIKREVDFKNPREEDREFLEKYKETVKEMHGAIRRYHLDLTELAREKKLRLVLHYGGDYKKRKNVELEEAIKLAEQGEIVSIHCSSCNQQIDTFS